MTRCFHPCRICRFELCPALCEQSLSACSLSVVKSLEDLIADAMAGDTALVVLDLDTGEPSEELDVRKLVRLVGGVST